MSDPTNVAISDRKGHLVLSVTAAGIGPRESAEIVAAAVSALGRGDRRGRCFVIDLSRVSALTSMGLGMCVDLRNRASDHGMQPVVAGMNDHLISLFRMMRVDRLFRTAANAAELERLLS